MPNIVENALRNATAYVRRSALLNAFAELVGNHNGSYTHLIACSYIYVAAASDRPINRQSIVDAISHLQSRSSGYRLVNRLIDAGWLDVDLNSGLVVATEELIEQYNLLNANLAVLGGRDYIADVENAMTDYTIWYDLETLEYLFAENIEAHLGWHVSDIIGEKSGFLTYPDHRCCDNSAFHNAAALARELPDGAELIAPCVAVHKETGAPVHFLSRLTKGMLGIKPAIIARAKVLDPIDWQVYMESHFETCRSQEGIKDA